MMPERKKRFRNIVYKIAVVGFLLSDKAGKHRKADAVHPGPVVPEWIEP